MSSAPRKIIHIDMDCFYAAVEMRDRPDLKSRPMAVGGRPDGRGVITTCNYKAREFGVRSAISSREALRRCPDLVILPHRFAKYKEVSQQVRDIFKRYSLCFEPISLDEAYLDVSDNKQFNGSATRIAEAIRNDIFQELDLTASAGIAANKFLAKVASDWNKPNGQLTIAPTDVDRFIVKLPVKKIPGVGKATFKRMQKMDVETCADLQKFSLEDMRHRFGSFGDRLYDLCRGVDHSTVKPSRQRKSISVESTFFEDLKNWPDIKKKVEKVYDELELRIRKAKLENESFKSLQVKFKTSDFVIASKERALPFSKENFLKLAEDHFLETNEPIRLLGLGCKLDVKSEKKSRGQLVLF